jgi:hypothetical protein
LIDSSGINFFHFLVFTAPTFSAVKFFYTRVYVYVRRVGGRYSCVGGIGLRCVVLLSKAIIQLFYNGLPKPLNDYSFEAIFHEDRENENAYIHLTFLLFCGKMVWSTFLFL